jgi:hypothetical protein
MAQVGHPRVRRSAQLRGGRPATGRARVTRAAAFLAGLLSVCTVPASALSGQPAAGPATRVTAAPAAPIGDAVGRVVVGTAGAWRGAGSVAARPVPGAAVVPAALPSGYPLWTLQLNLCNSGIAGCYDGGRSIPEAAGVIRSWWPDVVTLNEVCRNDVLNVLYPTMQQIWSGQQVFWAFSPALDKSRNAPYQCANGDQYGVGIVGHLVGVTGTVTTLSGYYPTQDGGNEGRTWLCVRAGGQYDACTTHLSKTGSIALVQCRYLMNTVIPGSTWGSAGRNQTVVGADLNLRYGGSPNAQDCVPAGWYRKGDGSVQHVLATSELRFDFSQKIGLQHTDHPGWLVGVDAP